MSQKNPIIGFYNSFKKEIFSYGSDRKKEWEKIIENSGAEVITEAMKVKGFHDILITTANTSCSGPVREKIFKTASKLRHEQDLKK